MADIKLSTIAGSGGDFDSGLASGMNQVNSGATGTLVTISPSSGKKVRLTTLRSGGAQQSNLTTVTVGGRTVVSGKELSASTSISFDSFSIGGGPASNLPIKGKEDEDIIITTNVATSQNTWYAFEESE